MKDVNSVYVDWLNDPAVNQFLETRHILQSIRTVNDFVSSTINNSRAHLFTIRSDNGIHIGNIKIGALDINHGTADISLFIGNKRFWGQGIATEAIKLITAYAVLNLKLRKLSASAYSSNVASTKAFLKAGYQYDGIKKSHFISNEKAEDAVNVCFFSHQLDHAFTVSMTE